MFTWDCFYFRLHSVFLVSCLFTEYQWELEMESGSKVFLLPLTDIWIRFSWAFSFPSQSSHSESYIRDVTFQPLHNLHNHSMNLLQCGHLCLVLGSLKHDVVSLLLGRGGITTAIRMLATLPNESQYAVGLPSCNETLLLWTLHPPQLQGISVTSYFSVGEPQNYAGT